MTMFRNATTTPALTAVLTLLLFAGPGTAAAVETADAAPDSTLSLEGDRDGTVFRSLTVEGENRVQIRFERPDLAVDIDPSTAPGLDWGTPMDVLNRTVPDLTGPLLETSRAMPSPYGPRPWVTAYRTGSVAEFTFAMEDVDRWNLTVVDSRGTEVARFQGRKNPPERLAWDGRQLDGSPALPGLTYSYVLEAFDKAGNRRRFVGEGFGIEAYRVEDETGPRFLVSGDQWRAAAREAAPVPSVFLLETASWINRVAGPDEPILVTATAGTYAEAMALGDQVADELRPLLPGEDVRVAVAAVAQPGTPAGGILQIRTGTSGQSTGE
jgi:hypothetical protein